jgi:HEAT repeat protein
MSKPEDVPALIATLRSDTASPHDKGAACRQLAVVGTRDAVAALAALLPDAKLSHMARFALEPMPDPAAGDALRSAMGQLHGNLLVGVINSIGVRRDSNAVAALSKRLSDADPQVAAAAASALGRIGTPAAATALRQGLAKAPVSLRPVLADASLGCAEVFLADNRRTEALALYDELRSADLPKRLQVAAMRGAILARQAQGVPLLLEQLRTADRDTAALALRVARELPGRDVTVALVAGLSFLPAGKQALLVQAIGDRGDPSALPAVLDAIKNGAPEVRMAAIRALPKIGDASSVPALLDAAAQKDLELAEAARTCLSTLPGQSVDTALVAKVNAGEQKTRQAAIDAVARRRVASAVPELFKASSDAEPAVRVAAVKALGDTVGLSDFSALADLLGTARNADEFSAVEGALSAACLRLPDKEACARKLLAVLAQAGAEAKRALLHVLSQAGGPEALQAVRAAAQGTNAQVRDTAIRALTDWANIGAAPDLLQLIRAGDNPVHRALAFRGYVRLAREPETAADARLKMLSEAMALAQNTDDRKLVLGALGEVATVEALDFAAKQLATPELADEAGAAAVKIATALGDAQKQKAIEALQQVQRSAKAKPVLDGASRQLRRLGVQPKENP